MGADVLQILRSNTENEYIYYNEVNSYKFWSTPHFAN
jgi:hypothetical protein